MASEVWPGTAAEKRWQVHVAGWARSGLSSASRSVDSSTTWPANRLLELAPAFWKQTLQQQDTQQRLAANVLRTVTLAEHHANA